MWIGNSGWSLTEAKEKNMTGKDRTVLAIAWAAYSVPFLAAYGTELVAFLRDWKELIGSALGVFGAFWVASFTNRQNTRNAMRQSEATLTKGDIESMQLDILSLRRHSIASTDYRMRLGDLVQRYAALGTPVKETHIKILEKIKAEFCDTPLPKELDAFSIANDPRGLTAEIQAPIAHLYSERQQLISLISHAINPNNKADEVRDSCILIAGGMMTCCLAINQQIVQQVTLINKLTAQERARYRKLRNWDRD